MINGARARVRALDLGAERSKARLRGPSRDLSLLSDDDTDLPKYYVNRGVRLKRARDLKPASAYLPCFFLAYLPCLPLPYSAFPYSVCLPGDTGWI